MIFSGGNGDFSPSDSEGWNLEMRGRGTPALQDYPPKLPKAQVRFNWQFHKGLSALFEWSKSPAQGHAKSYWQQSARSRRTAEFAAGRLSTTQRAHLVTRNLRNRGENAPSRDDFSPQLGPGASAPRPGRRPAAVGPGTGRRRGGRVGGGAHLYRAPPRRRGRAWVGAAESEVCLVPQTPPARKGRGEGEGGRRRHECGVAPVHLRSSPGSRRLSKAGPGCGSGGGGSGLGGLRRWSQAAAPWVGAAGASGRPARVDRVGRPLPGVQDGSASLGRGPGGQVARASYADRPPRGTCRSGPGPLLRRPDDCGRPGVAALGGPRARLVEAPLARALRGPGACFVLAPGMLLKGSGEISADARGWRGSKGHGRAV